MFGLSGFLQRDSNLYLDGISVNRSTCRLELPMDSIMSTALHLASPSQQTEPKKLLSVSAKFNSALMSFVWRAGLCLW